MSNLIDALWVDYLDCDTETTDAEAQLLTAVRADSGLALAWTTDHSLDCTLRSLNHLAETEEAFVAEWEQRVQEPAYSQQKLSEPPVAEPPVAKRQIPGVQISGAQILGSARQVTAQHRQTRYSPQTQATAALVATVALLAMVAISFWILGGNCGIARHETPPQKSNAPAKVVPIPSKEENPVIDRAPTQLVLPKPAPEPDRIMPVVWQTGGPENKRLPRGRHRLQSGLVELIGGNATPVTITAPAEVKVGDDDSWFVQRGTVAVSDLPRGERLPIITPNSRINSQGAEFVVTVNDAGQTDLQVRRGEVHLLSGTEGESAAPLKLLSGEFERAQLSPPGKEHGPAFCQLQGPENRFCGLIQLDGKTLRFASPEEFQDFQRQVEEQFTKDAEDLRRQWPDLVRALGGLGGGEIQLQRDGEPLEIQTLEQLLDFLKKLPAPPGVELKPGELKPGAKPGLPKLDPPKIELPKLGIPKPGDANSIFQGTIIINGHEQKFNSAEEFNAARKKHFDQLGPLGPIELPDLDKLNIPLP